MSYRSCIVVLALSLAACSHNLITSNVRAIDVNKDREFTYEKSSDRLVADNAAGHLLELWMDARQVSYGRLTPVGRKSFVTNSGRTERAVADGCHGGFLIRRTDLHAAADRVFVQVCPRDGTPADSGLWHADFEEVVNNNNQVALPPTALFDFHLSPTGDALIVSTETSHVHVALPQSPTSFFRLHPEVLAFVVITGIVPQSPQGMYEVAEDSK